MKTVILVLTLGLALGLQACSQTDKKIINKDNMSHSNTELATFGGGCFWCVEAVFDKVDGVKEAVSGYAAGDVVNPSYKEVCTGRTGHAEVVQISFDPDIVSYEELLDIFFHTHNPTTLNMQGNDMGTQYRSIILYHNQSQKEMAEAFIQKANEGNDFGAPIVTELVPVKHFYKAEEYHQNYFAKNPNQPYCSYVIQPKLEKFEFKYTGKLKEK